MEHERSYDDPRARSRGLSVQFAEGLNMSDRGGELYNLLKRIAALRRAPKTKKGRYHAARSPYKPVLLLTVLRRIQQGKAPYANNRIEFDACIRDFGLLYSRLFGEPGEIETKVTQAFWYLASDAPKLWDVSPRPGENDELQRLLAQHAQIKTAGKLTRLVEFASFRSADWGLVVDSDVQQALISFLIAEHFSDVRHEIDRF
jgi:predicted restriction endonuclease